MTDQRKALFAACRALGMDDDARHDMLQSVVGVRSTKDMTPQQWGKVMNHLNRLTGHDNGFTGRKRDTSSEATKVRALWLMLHQIGEVRDPSEKALASYCKRIAKVDDLHWAGNKIHVLIETLKKWAQRKLPAAISTRFIRLQLAGLISQHNSVQALFELAAPTRKPETFEAQSMAWKFMDEVENGRT